ncbi:uncharacterized protein EI97DRAFT_215126 [Westerdykella ornata]|uniref:Uncharacterized protein n=1 Tax=Westerdykella ornata TaxID=318751 RepID=A0A6A6JRY2_WESOR|nr:uncharacterized protein EI97DRAFT_215126 [Westerdykella ornata]KAF2278618.1 hypothetical protein EI97DRAFT_215126 [Westerdykella ornata]
MPMGFSLHLIAAQCYLCCLLCLIPGYCLLMQLANPLAIHRCWRGMTFSFLRYRSASLESCISRFSLLHKGLQIVPLRPRELRLPQCFPFIQNVSPSLDFAVHVRKK